MSYDDHQALLGSTGNYGSTAKKDDEELAAAATRSPRHSRAWGKHDSGLLVQAGERPLQPLTRSLTSGSNKTSVSATPQRKRRQPVPQQSKDTAKTKGGLPYYIIYAIVNVIISLPGLYGYSAVIFNNPVFNDHMNALSKLVIFSSLVHQLGFLLFSSLNFAIGTVQDAGLVFLSSMSNKIANHMLDDGHTQEEIVSTTLVLLSAGTALLGIVLILMGKFQLADAVSYLPMPVVGGYLAFIGYFCLEAGVALCISESIMVPSDWRYLLDPQNLLLAIPGLVAGLCMTLVSRKVENDAALPLFMVLIPSIFYIIIFAAGIGMDGAREGGWVGEVAPPVPISDLFKLVDFSQVQWSLVCDILPTWIGMVRQWCT